VIARVPRDLQTCAHLRVCVRGHPCRTAVARSGVCNPLAVPSEESSPALG
jgi:uncharacterized Fe-S cluster protein YjdI